MTYGFDIEPVNRRVTRSNLAERQPSPDFSNSYSDLVSWESLEHLERATVGKSRRTIASQEPTICPKGAGQLVT